MSGELGSGADGDRGAGGDIGEVDFSHVAGHADAAVGSGVTWEEAFVHADAAIEAHEVGHFGTFEAGARGHGVFGDVDVFFDHVAGAVHVVAVEVGFVPLVLLGDFEVAGGSAVGGVASGEGGDPGEFAAFVEVGFLVTEVDDDTGGAGHAFAIPVGDVVGHEGVGGGEALGVEGLEVLSGSGSAASAGEGAGDGGKEEGGAGEACEQEEGGMDYHLSVEIEAAAEPRTEGRVPQESRFVHHFLGERTPDAFDHEGFGVWGDAAFVLVELGGKEVDGGLAYGFGALIEAGDVGVVGAPTEGGEVGSEVGREGLNPGGEVVAGVEDGVGLGGGEPFEEGGALEFTGEVEEAGGGGGSEGMVDEEAGGPGAEHALVEDGGGAVGDAFVAGFFEVSQGGVHAFEVVVMDAIEGGGGEAEADDDRAEFVPGEAEMTAALAEEGADDETVDAAMFEDFG
jgi:hypothetical protein